MSDQPITPTPPSTKSLDDILNELEKTAGKSPASEPTPLQPIPANQNPILSSSAPEPVPAAPETTPVIPPPEVQAPIESTPAPVEPVTTPDVPPMPEPNPEPAPVATLAENPIAAPPQQERPEAAPMVKEEPLINTQKAVVAPLPLASSEEVKAAAPTPPSSNKGKIIAGVIGVLLLTGVAGIGMFLTSQNQDNRSPAATPVPIATYVAPPITPTPATLPTATPIPQPGTEAPRATGYRSLPTIAASTSTAEINGLVCQYGKNFVAGTVVFFNPDKQAIFSSKIATNQNVFTAKVPIGKYIAFFYPTDITLPPFAYTKYVTCGLNPAKCIDHSPLLMTLEAKKVYGQVQICDPQVSYKGLPDALRQ